MIIEPTPVELEGYTRPPNWLLVAIGFLICAVVALGLAVVLLARTGARQQPLSVVACDPRTYAPPVQAGDETWPPGPSQEECTTVFAEPNDSWPTTEPVPVAGQLCNFGDTAVSYTMSVTLVPVDRPDLPEFRLLDPVPITYPPGCQAPYDIAWQLPEELARLEGTLGRWRAVGRATPTEPDRFSTYQWDSFASVTLVKP